LLKLKPFYGPDDFLEGVVGMGGLNWLKVFLPELKLGDIWFKPTAKLLI